MFEIDTFKRFLVKKNLECHPIFKAPREAPRGSRLGEISENVSSVCNGDLLERRNGGASAISSGNFCTRRMPVIAARASSTMSP